MNKNQSIDKRAELKAKISALNEKLCNPSVYRIDKDTPYSYSSQMEADRIKLNDLLKEYRTIANVQVSEGTIELKKHLSFRNDLYELRYVPEKDAWHFYRGSIFLTDKVTFPDDETALVTHTTVSSDNYSEPVDHIYTLKCKSSPDAIVTKAKPVPCTIVDAGIAVMKQNDDYWKSLGFIKDKETGALRRQTPLEYEAKQKADPNYQAPKTKAVQKKGIKFSSFLGRKNK